MVCNNSHTNTIFDDDKAEKYAHFPRPMRGPNEWIYRQNRPQPDRQNTKWWTRQFTSNSTTNEYAAWNPPSHVTMTRVCLMWRIIQCRLSLALSFSWTHECNNWELERQFYCSRMPDDKGFSHFGYRSGVAGARVATKRVGDCKMINIKYCGIKIMMMVLRGAQFVPVRFHRLIDDRRLTAAPKD